VIAAFTDQRDRMKRTLNNALAGATYESSHEEGPSILVLEARRVEGGQHIGVRFLGVQRWDGSFEPSPGTPIVLRGVTSSSKGISFLLSLLNPYARTRLVTGSRVRIDVGAARLDIECQDVEWWQDDAAPGETSAVT